MQAIVFDFDGLILDTETPEFTAWQSVFADHGLVLPTEWWGQFMGRGVDMITEWPIDLLDRLVENEIDREAIHGECRARCLAEIDRQTIRPGVVDLLDDCEREGVRVAIASSSKHHWVESYLEKVGLQSRFDIICCADDVEKAKPFPDLYLMALDRLGLEASDAIALEDSPNGIAAALAAGMFVFVIPNPATALLDISRASARLDSMAGQTVQTLRAQAFGTV